MADEIKNPFEEKSDVVDNTNPELSIQTDDVKESENVEATADEELEGVFLDNLIAETDEDELYTPKPVVETPEPEPKKKGLFGKKKEKKPKKPKEKKPKEKKPKVKKEKKKSIMSFVTLKNEIESHGFKYSFRSFLLQATGYVIASIAIAYVSKLNLPAILILVVMALVATPYIVRAQFDQMYQIARFQMVVNYLDNVIPIFKNKPLIASAWKEVLDLTEGKMHDLLAEAINYILTNTKDPTPELTAFEIIEKEFPNTRIHSVHQMMYTIVRQNSVSYQQSVDNMYYDVQGWISRTYNFQKDLAQRRTKMILLCLLTMGCNCMFVFMYASSEFFAGFTDVLAYQVSTFAFIAVMLLMICLVMIQMNGVWLVNDKIDTESSTYEKAFKRAVLEPNPNPTVPQIAMALMSVAAGCYLYMTTRQLPALAGMCLMGALFAFKNKMDFNAAKKKVQRAMEIEFPIWLRDVALNLQNLTVINSIENSIVTVSPIFAYYINQFIAQIQKDPTKIKPFNDFLDICDAPDIKASMKVLYTLQSLKDDQILEQTNSLIVRNQSMIAKSEQMKNEDSIGAIESLGFLPVAMFSLQMLISMALLFSFMMGYMADAMTGI